MLQQRHDIDTAPLQHRAGGEVELVHAQIVDYVGHLVVRAREEARADAEGLGPEPEVEARRLDLGFPDLALGGDLAASDQLAQMLGRQKAGRMPCLGHAFVGARGGRLLGKEPERRLAPDR